MNTQTPEPSASQSAGATADAAEPGTVSSVNLVDCAAPHLYEVYAEGAIAADAFPDGGLMEQYVADICYDAFENYVGTSYDDAYAQGRYAVTSLRPTQRTWEQGDRRVSCLLTSVDGGELTGSARGADN
ncbi:septum formation family protein [Actinomyces ruminis]|uniref:septum formation family protein n=1 Tax=Actinomyces ruminis TaxID=1937003 RepID=UPI000B698CA5|nr:septum formation family protein [Actinomyces ruminis]